MSACHRADDLGSHHRCDVVTTFNNLIRPKRGGALLLLLLLLLLSLNIKLPQNPHTAATPKSFGFVKRVNVDVEFIIGIEIGRWSGRRCFLILHDEISWV